jgi:hypothetical protein
VQFHRASDPGSRDLQRLQQTLRRRVLRLFLRRELLEETPVENMLTWQAAGGFSLVDSVRNRAAAHPSARPAPRRPSARRRSLPRPRPDARLQSHRAGPDPGFRLRSDPERLGGAAHLWRCRTVADPHPHRSPDPPGQARTLRVTSQTTDAQPSHSASPLTPSLFRTYPDRGPESAPKPSLDGTGWPSFTRPIEGALETKPDFKIIWPRPEYQCARCGGHQVHVFGDRPRPTGKSLLQQRSRPWLRSEGRGTPKAARHQDP